MTNIVGAYSPLSTNGTNGSYQTNQTKPQPKLEETAQFQADRRQLQQDNLYFSQLEQRLLSGDPGAAEEVRALQAGTKMAATDSNAKLYNQNTDKIHKLQQYVQSYNASHDDSSRTSSFDVTI